MLWFSMMMLMIATLSMSVNGAKEGAPLYPLGAPHCPSFKHRCGSAPLQGGAAGRCRTGV